MRIKQAVSTFLSTVSCSGSRQQTTGPLQAAAGLVTCPCPYVTPRGRAGVIEGFSFDLPGVLIGDWPGNWNTTLGGFYEACFAVPNNLLEGDGNWTLTVQNAWGGSFANVSFEGSVTLFYLCNLEPEEPDTSQFMAADTIMVQFAFESQNASFSILDLDGNPLDVLCSGDEEVLLEANTSGGTWSASCLGCLDFRGGP